MKKGKKPRLIGEQELLLVARVKEAVFQLKVFFFNKYKLCKFIV